jgi:DUF1680 family protein
VVRVPDFVYGQEADGIRVNLYESSQATLDVQGRAVNIRQVSAYPDQGQVTLQLRPDQALDFTLRLRVPAHTGAPAFTLNGGPVQPGSEAGGYYHFRREWSGDELTMSFGIPTVVRPFLNEAYGVLVRGPEVLAVDQRDNPALDLDRVVLPTGIDLTTIEPAMGRRRYAGQALVGGQPAQVVFTPYADCGGESARFRTAFPIAQ